MSRLQTVDNWNASADDLEVECRIYASPPVRSPPRGEEAGGLSTNSHSSWMSDCWGRAWGGGEEM